MTINILEIESAAHDLNGNILQTPFSLSHSLTEKLNCEIFVKYENRQYTSSFKVRGAYTKLTTLSDEQKSNGVVAMSAGNHAQGLAYNSKQLGIPATIVMPDSTPFNKIRSTQELGADVVIKGSNLLESEIYAEELSVSRGLTFVHPFNDKHVIRGQATVAFEMLSAVPDLNTLIVPVGGGGLIAGSLVAAKSINPSIKIIGVEVERYPSLTNAINGQSKSCEGSTLAEGIAVSEIGDIPLSIIKGNIDDVLVVSESSIERAIAMFALVDKTISEGAGAAGLAAVLEYPDKFKSEKVGLILCGGNIDSRMLSSVLMRDMVRKGQVVTLSITIPDKPGQLQAVSGICANAGANVLAVEHGRFALDLAASSARLDITIETRDHDHATEIIQIIRSAGYLATILESD